MEDIILNARYGLKHKLRHLNDNLWVIDFDPNSSGTYRIIGFKGESKVGSNVSALDPEGGPYLSVNSEIDGYIIKSIKSNGIFELIKKD